MTNYKAVKYVEEINIKRIRVTRVRNEKLKHLEGRIFNLFAVARNHDDQIKVFFRDRDQTMYSLDVDCVENATLKIVK